MSRIVYLLHFERPLLNARARYTAGVQHYLGSTNDLAVRLAEHRNGRGARLPAVFAERGIPFELARTWRGGRMLERRLKNYKKSWRLCPVCCVARKALAA